MKNSVTPHLKRTDTPRRSTLVAPPLSGSSWRDFDEVRDFFLQNSANPALVVVSGGRRAAVHFSDPPSVNPANRLAAYFWIYARQYSRAGQENLRSGERLISNGRYGGSQAGAILSYRISAERAPEIALYGRLSTALAPLDQKEIALGARIHPVQDLPVAVHAEQRFELSSGAGSGTALYLTGGSGPDRVAGSFVLETYAQAGYVLGRNDTYFYDGSAVLQRPVAQLGATQLSAGSGAWVGGQRGVSRVDVGPRATLTIPVGKIAARIAVDWRFRVAGNARPGNGAAITVSTGF